MASHVCWVNPATVEYGSSKTFNPLKDRGKVIGGKWDIQQPKRKITDSNWYKATQERVIDGKPWSQTLLYRKGVENIERHGRWLRYTSVEELRKRFNSVEAILQSIKKNGYFEFNPRGDEVSINIGRHGDLFFNDGIHRLCIAKVLGLKRIPVQIIVRHPEWARFKRELEVFARKRKGRLYHPVTHPDLQRIPVAHDDSRFHMIRKNMTVKNGTLLDIGANLGFFCFKFEELGFDCHAVEQEPRLVYFMEKLRRAERRKFKIIPKSVFQLEKTDFDVVLALNVFHHFIKKKGTFDQLKKLLARLSMREMFFQAHDPAGSQMRTAYANFKPDNFANFIMNNSCLSKKKKIGHTEDGRTLFRLWGTDK